jgi:hypothetical protein
MADDSIVPGTMTQRIYELVAARGGVHFHDLADLVPGFNGDLDYEITKNCVIWRGMSLEAFEALRSLTWESNLLGFAPLSHESEAVRYVSEYIGLPLVHCNQVLESETPCWLPVAIATHDWLRSRGLTEVSREALRPSRGVARAR